ncbi:tripartite tricarboxylate transporter TctB family protein [Glycomyces niveus]|uniref:Tripartite tricarboxylate transporter TctB family protein n=1 Tax=Glycomyces niveus TaxID=2820287 RepID=A0ABS3U0A9_9ACTN|nr:tripartite tricarboxylate transporter TctB family protein [Glycomyces sp. NEAU-S30]MBO3731906.1 tripartite tricarboxylate transporter TctB family protein [Glycomyces sp. NEAU-S30]
MAKVKKAETAEAAVVEAEAADDTAAAAAPEAAQDDEVDEGPRAGGRVQSVVAGAVPVVLGAVAAWLSFGLDIGSLTEPGPGLWPLIVAGLLVASGIGIIAVTAKTRRDTEAFTRGTVAVLAAAGGLAVYASLYEVVGFEVPTVLLLFAWLRFLSRESWLMSAVLAVAVTAVAYVLFIIGLNVPLPHIIAF